MRTNFHGWIPGITLLGAMLVIAATLLHPITIDPWNADLPVHLSPQIGFIGCGITD